jgi:hypothetical protein
MEATDLKERLVRNIIPSQQKVTLMKISVWFAMFLAIFTAPLFATTNMMIGNWTTPDHSIVTVYPCE